MIYVITSPKTSEVSILESEKEIEEVLELCKVLNYLAEDKDSKDNFTLQPIQEALISCYEMQDAKTEMATKWVNRQAIPIVDAYKKAVVAISKEAVHKAYIINLHAPKAALLEVEKFQILHKYMPDGENLSQFANILFAGRVCTGS